MTFLLPRIDLEQVENLMSEYQGLTADDLTGRMPREDVQFGQGTVGTRIFDETLRELREQILKVAVKHGFPEKITKRDRSGFDTEAAWVVRDLLKLTPHEASQEDGWSCITCCWLMDVAVWRWGVVGEGTDSRRFRGDVNRGTFRRLWWRIETLGADLDLSKLGEDQFVNIMERSTITRHRGFAREIARQAIVSQETGLGGARAQDLVRDASKRLLRMTPFVAFESLNPEQLEAIVSEAFEMSGAALEGREAETYPSRQRPSGRSAVATNNPDTEDDPRAHEVAESGGGGVDPKPAVHNVPPSGGRSRFFDEVSMDELLRTVIRLADDSEDPIDLDGLARGLSAAGIDGVPDRLQLLKTMANSLSTRGFLARPQQGGSWKPGEKSVEDMGSICSPSVSDFRTVARQLRAEGLKGNPLIWKVAQKSGFDRPGRGLIKRAIETAIRSA